MAFQDLIDRTGRGPGLGLAGMFGRDPADDMDILRGPAQEEESWRIARERAQREGLEGRSLPRPLWPEAQVTELTQHGPGGLGTVVSPDEGGVSVADTRRRIGQDQRARRAQSGGQAPAQEPTPQERAERIAYDASVEAARQLAEINQRERDERARVNLNAERRAGLAVFAAGGTRGQVEIARRVERGEPVGVADVEALQDIATLDLSRPGRATDSRSGVLAQTSAGAEDSQRGRGAREARRLLAGIQTRVRAGMEAAAQALGGRVFGTAEEYGQAAQEAVGGEGVPGQVRDIVLAQVLRNPSEAQVKAWEKTGEQLRNAGVAEQIEDARGRKESLARYAAGFPEQDREQVIREVQSGDQNNVHVRAVEQMELERKGRVTEGQRRQERDTSRDIEAGRIDLFNDGHVEALVAGRVLPQSAVDAYRKWADTPLPADAGSYALTPAAETAAVSEAVAQIGRGIDPEKAVVSAIGTQEGAGTLRGMDDKGRAYMTARIKQGVAKQVDAQARTRNAEAVRVRFEQEAKLIEAPVKEETGWLDSAQGQKQVAAWAQEMVVQGKSPEDMAREIAQVRVGGRFGAQSPVRGSVSETIDAWGTERQPEQARLAPVNAYMDTLARGLEAARVQVVNERAVVDATRKAELERQKAIAEEHAERGLEVRFYESVSESGKPSVEPVTFRMDSPEEMDAMREFDAASTDQRKRIVARQAERHTRYKQARADLDTAANQLERGAVRMERTFAVDGAEQPRIRENWRASDAEEDWDATYEWGEEKFGGEPELFAEFDLRYKKAKKERDQRLMKKMEAGLKLPKGQKPTPGQLTEMYVFVKALNESSESWLEDGFFAGGAKPGTAEVRAAGGLLSEAERATGLTLGGERVERQISPDRPAPSEYQFGTKAAYDRVAKLIPDGQVIVVGGSRFKHEADKEE
jgi:hypothetical protein